MVNRCILLLIRHVTPIPCTVVVVGVVGCVAKVVLVVVLVVVVVGRSGQGFFFQRDPILMHPLKVQVWSYWSVLIHYLGITSHQFLGNREARSFWTPSNSQKKCIKNTGKSSSKCIWHSKKYPGRTPEATTASVTRSKCERWLAAAASTDSCGKQRHLFLGRHGEVGKRSETEWNS